VGMSRGLSAEYGTPLPICILRTIPGIKPGGKRGYGECSATVRVTVGSWARGGVAAGSAGAGIGARNGGPAREG
jgi:hypothetical protein